MLGHQGLTLMLQRTFIGTFKPTWLLEECRLALTRIARSGKPQATLAAGALAGLSGAFSVCEVCAWMPLLKASTSLSCNSRLLCEHLRFLS